MFIHVIRMYIIIKIQKTVSSSQFEFIQKIKSYIEELHVLVVRQRKSYDIHRQSSGGTVNKF